MSGRLIAALACAASISCSTAKVAAPPMAAPAPEAGHQGHGASADTTEHAGHHMPMPADTSAHAGHDVTAASAPPAAMAMDHAMTMVSLGGGWMAIGMAQAIPTATVSLPSDDGTPLDRRGLYLTQPALMLNIESRESRVALRTTLNFEGLTQPDGELTFGGWGEGFLDKRHPHTYLHEAMLSVNVWAQSGGGFSISAGKGFAPYGTDDPMSRPVIKYPTNHHLSQILERFTLNAVYVNPLWSVEAGVFGGNEPTSPGDFSNAESFANSWSARVTRHFGLGAMGTWPFELGASYGYIEEEHGEHDVTVTKLFNLSLRHENDHEFGRLYSLAEWSVSNPDEGDGYFSVLGEASVTNGAHKPYARVEYATRPEYPRAGAPGSRGFFRYDHDDHAIGSTRWLTVVGGYGVTATQLPFSARPYAEIQWNRVSADRGGIEPEVLFGRDSFFTLSAGLRLFLGGEPMRMGAYGALDAMTLMHRMQMVGPAAGHRH